jgi:hypothetical protein
MKRVRAVLLLSALFTFGMSSPALLGCENKEGPMEEAGEALDEAGEEIEDEIDDAT